MNVLPDEKIGAITAALGRGESLRTIAASVGVSKRTVFSYRKLYLVLGFQLPPCECGEPAGHRGWCHERFVKSPKRQAFIARLHENQTKRELPKSELLKCIVPRSSGEEMLMLAALQDALRTLKCPYYYSECWTPADAKEWFKSEEKRYPFSFVAICDHFDLDPQWLRQKIARMEYAKLNQRHELPAGDGLSQAG